jgi:hypothetical protein
MLAMTVLFKFFVPYRCFDVPFQGGDMFFLSVIFMLIGV